MGLVHLRTRKEASEVRTWCVRDRMIVRLERRRGGQIIQVSVPMAGSLILRAMVKNQWCDGNQI